MTLAEAIGSGRRFRRPSSSSWINVEGRRFYKGKDSWFPSIIAITATDWMVEPSYAEKYSLNSTITLAQLDVALCNAGYAINYASLREIGRFLGLEDTQLTHKIREAP